MLLAFSALLCYFLPFKVQSFSLASRRFSPKINSISRNKQTTFDLSSDFVVDTKGILFSGLKGKALRTGKVYPTLNELKKVLGNDITVKSTKTSLSFAALDIFSTSFCIAIGWKYILPLINTLLTTSAISNKILSSVLAGLLYFLYSAASGTAAIGMWVTAHECGHGAFSDNRFLQDTVGYIFHSILLVPYFSWQR
jgi:omega-6 fatty acid desaturase (delta-12 desaturase)